MPENTIPVKGLRAVIGSRWRRTGLLSAAGEQPIFHLVRQDRPDDLTAQLGGHLGGGVPHVLLSADQDLPDNELDRSVLMREQLLDKVALGLGRHDSRRWQGRIRFRRYALASYLLQHNEEPPEPDEVPNRQARELLGTYVRGRLFGLKNRKAETEGAGASARVDATVNRVEPLGLPWYLLLPAMLLSWIVPPAIRRGVVLRRPARWFLRQHYLSPRESADFASFAQRLLSTPSVHENANQVRKFLVHALLEDLADAYARRVWRWRWMRRDNYPVLLLQGVTPGTTGELLIRLINDVRNETGARDPLLVVASGMRELPHGTAAPEEPITVRAWQNRLLEARRKRSPTAWYLPIQVEDPPTDVEPRPAFPRSQAPIRTTRARILRVVPAFLLVLVLAGVGGWYFAEWREHCGRLRPWADSGLIWTDPDGIGGINGECVGVTDKYAFSAGGDDGDEARTALVAAQHKIYELNAEAEKVHLAQPELPYPTIVYFSVLTTANNDSTALTAALEELGGIADAQEQARRRLLPLRVLIANGGDGMRHAPEVAAKMNALARDADRTNAEARGDGDRSGGREATSPIVGVVGLGGSREITKTAITDLGNEGLPSIGITTSEDSMWESSELYFQIAPPNEDQARVVGEYVENHLEVPAKKVSIYRESGDIYSENLAADIEADLQRRGIEVGIMNETEELDRPCGRGEVLFFAGRSERLDEFLGDQPCGPGEHPQLIAGDDITKFVLNARMRDRSDLRLDYVSFNRLRHAGTSQGRSALAHDAIKLLEQAAGKFKKNLLPLNGLTVWNELSHTKSMKTGNTGAIVYDHSDDDQRNDQVPVHKAITIERIEGGAPESRTLLVCGDHQANTADRPEGCTWLGD